MTTRDSCITEAALAADHNTSSPNHKMLFENFKIRYGKMCNDINEESVRFGKLKTNDGISRASDARSPTYTLETEWKSSPQTTWAY